MQRALYFARKRRRSLRSIPKLYRTNAVPPGNSQADPFDSGQYIEPVTFRFSIDTGLGDGVLFNYGSDISVALAGSLVTVTINGQVQSPFTLPRTGKLDLILSIRPGDGAVRVWDECSQIVQFVATGISQAWASAGATLNAGSLLIGDLSVYVAQLPQHFLNIIEAGQQPDSDDFWLASTALFFMTDFKQPLFES